MDGLRLLPLGLALLGATGCALNCTEMGCYGSLEVTLLGVDADSAEIIEVEAFFTDGNSSSCEVDLADVGSLCAGASWDGERLVVPLWTPMGISGDAELVVSSSAGELHAEEVALEWSEPTYPNGEICDRGEGCTSSAAELDLSGALDE